MAQQELMDVAAIIAKARAATGLHDLGDPSAVEALALLTRATQEEAELSETGAQRWHGFIVANLIIRLRIVDYLKTHPELLERPIDKPMFVFGLPRTGTTLTINLLSTDPARRCLLRWEAHTLTPVPPARAGELRSDPRYHAEQKKIAKTLALPHIAAIHHEDADSPTECQSAMSPTFCSQVYDAQIDIPSYRKWFLSTSYLPALRFHKQFLQVLQENNAGRWTLKNPWHPLYLDDLTTVYPDAQLVMTHRDPAESVASACSLIRHLRSTLTDNLSVRDIAEQLLETFDLMIARQNAYRDDHGERAIYDLQYNDLLRDPIGQMRNLYSHFEEPFTPRAEAAMRAQLNANPQGKHGKHSYSLQEFGLCKTDIRKRYREYCDRFEIALKDA
jgi:hypothetical protein